MRVGVTGIGIVSPLGMNTEENWRRLIMRESGIADMKFPGYETFSHCRCGGIQNFDPQLCISNRKLLKLMNRESQLAFVAAQKALENSGIKNYYHPERIGLYLGTGLTSGNLESLIPIVENAIDDSGDFSYSLLGTKSLSKCNPLLSFKILPNMALSYISIEHNIKGPNFVFNPWSGNSAQGVLEALQALKFGEIDCAVVGGCDSKCNYVGFLTFEQLGLLSKNGFSYPFSKKADGIVLGEGSAFIVLENIEKALARNAVIYAEICGGASGADSFSRTLYPEDASCLEESMLCALQHAGIKKDEVDLICTSANSCPAGDATEKEAIIHLFGDSGCTRLTAFSYYTGDMIAAASIYALGMCSYSFLKKQQLPLAEAVHEDTQCDQGTKEMRTILVNAFSLGCMKTSIVIQKYNSN